MTYLALKEDSMDNGLYRGSRGFRVGEFREKSLREVLERGRGDDSRKDGISTRQKYQ